MGLPTTLPCLLLLSCFSHVWLLVTPWTIAYQAPPSLGFSRREYWSGLPLPSPPVIWEANLYEWIDSLASDLWVQFSHSVVFDSLQPRGLQHARPPCPSPTPGAYPNSCPSHQWCHPTISSSVLPFSSHLQSFPASGSFQMSWLFIPSGRSIGVSVSTSVLPMNTQDWSPLGWTGWISLQFKGLSRVFSYTTVKKHQFFSAQLSL